MSEVSVCLTRISYRVDRHCERCKWPSIASEADCGNDSGLTMHVVHSQLTGLPIASWCPAEDVRGTHTPVMYDYGERTRTASTIPMVQGDPVE